MSPPVSTLDKILTTQYMLSARAPFLSVSRHSVIVSQFPVLLFHTPAARFLAKL